MGTLGCCACCGHCGCADWPNGCAESLNGVAVAESFQNEFGSVLDADVGSDPPSSFRPEAKFGNILSTG